MAEKKTTTDLIPVSAFVPPHVKEMVREIATKERRSTSQVVRTLLEESPRLKSALRQKKRAA